MTTWCKRRGLIGPRFIQAQKGQEEDEKPEKPGMLDQGTKERGAWV
jgi:hypothetical protein